MKGYFIVHEEFNKMNLTGIQKKILSQIDVFCHYGLNCEKYYISKGTEKIGGFIAAGIALLPFGNKYPQWVIPDNIENMNYIYMRRPLCMNWAMRHWIKKVKKINRNLKIIVEIPTYPYDKEFDTILLKPFLLKDKYNRRKMKSLVDAFCVISSEEKLQDIWGIPAIPFQNGYDVKSVDVAKEASDKSCINVCCVAMFSFWHGYERLLLGLQEYYKNGGNREIKCHMIGDGPESDYYKKIADNKDLKNRVIFYGRQSGEHLASLYDQMDIGVCSLGIYKIGLGDSASVLKSREYMAKGMPMITGCKIDVFEGRNVDFVCEFENNDSILDVNKIVEFYDNIQQKENLRANIRQFALETIDMTHTMKPVIDLIKRIC